MTTPPNDNRNNHKAVNFNTGELTLDPINFTDILTYVDKTLVERDIQSHDSFKRQFNALFTEILFDRFNCELYSTKAISDTLPNVRTAVLMYNTPDTYKDEVFVKDSQIYSVIKDKGDKQ